MTWFLCNLGLFWNQKTVYIKALLQHHLKEISTIAPVYNCVKETRCPRLNFAQIFIARFTYCDLCHRMMTIYCIFMSFESYFSPHSCDRRFDMCLRTGMVATCNSSFAIYGYFIDRRKPDSFQTYNISAVHTAFSDQF